MNSNVPDLSGLLYILLLLVGAGLVVVVALLVFIIWRVRRINLPEGASFVTALKATPLSVVLLLDALDWSLDIFSAPITWILLGRLGLAPLRGVAVVKDLIPFTNFVPAMTLAWLVVRVLSIGAPHLGQPAIAAGPPPLLPPPDERKRRR